MSAGSANTLFEATKKLTLCSHIPTSQFAHSYPVAITKY